VTRGSDPPKQTKQKPFLPSFLSFLSIRFLSNFSLLRPYFFQDVSLSILLPSRPCTFLPGPRTHSDGHGLGGLVAFADVLDPQQPVGDAVGNEHEHGLGLGNADVHTALDDGYELTDEYAVADATFERFDATVSKSVRFRFDVANPALNVGYLFKDASTVSKSVRFRFDVANSALNVGYFFEDAPSVGKSVRFRFDVANSALNVGYLFKDASTVSKSVRFLFDVANPALNVGYFFKDAPSVSKSVQIVRVVAVFSAKALCHSVVHSQALCCCLDVVVPGFALCQSLARASPFFNLESSELSRCCKRQRRR